MKLQAMAITALIAVTGVASADWFNGFNNGTGSTNGNATALGNGNTTDNVSGADEENVATVNTASGDGFFPSIGNDFPPSFEENIAQNMMPSFVPNFNSPYTSNNFQPTSEPELFKMKAMWEAQRKQAEEMLKRIDAEQKTVAQN